MTELDIELAEAVLSLPWSTGDASVHLDDGPIASLVLLAEGDLSLALSVVRLPWLADDLSEDEETALVMLGELAGRDIALAQHMVALP